MKLIGETLKQISSSNVALYVREKQLAVINAISVILVLFVNYYSQAVGINGNRVGELSSQYDNTFTPASYAFAIWGIIFLMLIAYSIYQIREAFFTSSPSVSIQKTSYWFFLANLMNATWVIVWLYELTWLSVLVMFTLLICLMTIIVRNDIGRSEVSLKSKMFTWWPIGIYAGWIAVASIANVSAYLAKIGWGGGFFTEIQWTLMMIVIAIAVNLYMVLFRNLRSFALVGVWALFAIHVRHMWTYELLDTFALVGAGVLLFSVVLNGLKSGYSLVSSKN